MKYILKAFLVLFVLLQVGAYMQTSVSAQAQDFDFSGNRRESYQCFYRTQSGRLISLPPLDIQDSSGYWLCGCVGDITIPESIDNLLNEQPDPSVLANLVGIATAVLARPTQQPPGSGNYVCDDGEAVRATLKPPKLQQIEIWFIRIVYVIWALVASLSFFFLVALGYQYMVSRGDVTKVTEIRQRIINYFIGLVLVFLSVPILITIFNLLGINQDVDCYNEIQMPGFQFFFNDLCTGNGEFIDATGDSVAP